MPLLVVLDKYIDRIKKIEAEKPFHLRRPIPSYEEMAKRAGFSKQAFLDFVHNRPRGINREMAGTAIEMLRDCGFEVNASDIISYVAKDSI